MKNMNLFSQVLTLFPRTDFLKMVKEHKSEYRAKGFTSWQQLVAMLFCHLGKANSLSEITNGLASCEGKLRHLGIAMPKKSTLAYANEHRPWELFQSVFNGLLAQTVDVAAKHGHKFRFKSKLYSIDSTTIDLCQAMYPWAKFRRKKGAVKLHLRLDHDGYLPNFGLITDGKCHDVKAVWDMPFEADSITVFDRGYVDYSLFEHIAANNAWFVTRAKDNADYTIIEEREFIEDSGVTADWIVQLNGYASQKKHPDVLRIVEFYDSEHNRTLRFLTNIMHLSSQTIAAIYKERWQIELMFKTLKQNLKIKSFVGTSPNAVKIQIWTALIAILLLKYLQLKSKFGWSMSNLAALLRMNLFTYRNLWEWIDRPFDTPPDPIVEAEQMALVLG